MPILKREELIEDAAWTLDVPAPERSHPALRQACCLCGEDEGEPVAVGEDFDDRERRGDSFLVLQCRACGVAYLGRPSSGHVGAANERTY